MPKQGKSDRSVILANYTVAIILIDREKRGNNNQKRLDVLVDLYKDKIDYDRLVETNSIHLLLADDLLALLKEHSNNI